ncbi:reverse transcriptase (RNA-dependent DNA polymerase) [Novosphingobium sp. PhB57]|uniref:retron St85 family RNA-directed DNA polymerase n=1 Tax=Novosphingobium sp. PhB57 TaxID=2485107 RepID=UPI0010DB94D9|nr:retron St85 family RNA-directed DNA polymerase [Novosphingobium sp. PhB57]TCU59322.1 reverse transcriptase (RNA-dependent DNA polymerase) [Novosphingobium sp. PhB57]
MSKIIRLLTAETGLPTHDVRAIINRAPISYKHYTIKKRSGADRPIAQPAREVKRLQKILMGFLSDLPVHSAATAYAPGASIKDNAERHAKNGPILKFDFTNFFTSIRERDWKNYCAKYNLFDDPDDVTLSTKLFFCRVPGSTLLRLAIGAPSSPWLSNVLMYEFDDLISRRVRQDQVTYTRYADDLTFSARRTGYLTRVEKILNRTLSEMENPRLTLNQEKTVLATMKYRRVVTGLVLANDGRVTLGRERKRRIRAALHSAFAGKLDAEAMTRLAGMLAFVKSVEPEFFEQIAARYGENVISKLAGSQSQL